MQWVRRLWDTFLVIILRDVARYRFKVILNNLTPSFQPKLAREIRRKNYRFLSKLIRQVSLKPTRNLLLKKFDLEHNYIVNQWFKENRSIIVTMGHVGNWEWSGLYLGLKYPHHVCALYKQIKSPFVNKMMLARRGVAVDHLIEISKIGELLRLIKEKPVFILMIADQNPGNDQGIIWTDFFGRKTAFVSGPEGLAIRFHLPVVYLNNTSNGDEGYQLKWEIIYDGHASLPQGEITRRYTRALESNIREDPGSWLWSHKRWKRKIN